MIPGYTSEGLLQRKKCLESLFSYRCDRGLLITAVLLGIYIAYKFTVRDCCHTLPSIQCYI